MNLSTLIWTKTLRRPALVISIHNGPQGAVFFGCPMAVADVVVAASNSQGVPIARDGYSWPYVMAAALSSTLAGLGAVLLIYSLARRLFGDFAALLASILIWLATPMVYYQYYEPLFSPRAMSCSTRCSWCSGGMPDNGDTSRTGCSYSAWWAGPLCG